MQIKTQIKKACWSVEGVFKEMEIMNIYSPILYQGEDLFIESHSSLLFEIICNHFFYKNPDVSLELSLQGARGAMFGRIYMSYIYELIYEALTGKIDENGAITKESEDEEDLICIPHTKGYLQKIVDIIEILEIDFKEERQYKRLFDTRNKKNLQVVEL